MENIKEAQELIALEQQARVNSCRQELEELLKKHRCQLDVIMVITAKGNIPQLQIIAEQ